MIKIIIVDDHELIRLGIKSMIEREKDIVVADEAINGMELMEKIGNNQYDVVLLDIAMPGRDGIEILKQVKNIKPAIPVLILSIHLEKHYALRALRAGASGFLNKKVDSDEIVKAIRRVYTGKRYISESLADRLANEVTGDLVKLLHEKLSDREFEIMLLLARGLSLGEIGNKLNISPKTVTTYRARILTKMGFTTNADITRYVIEYGLMDD